MTPIPLQWMERSRFHPIPSELTPWVSLKSWNGAWALFQKHGLRSFHLTEWIRPPHPGLSPQLFRGVWYWSDGPITAEMVEQPTQKPRPAPSEPDHLEDIDPSRSSARGKELLPYMPGRHGWVKVDELLAQQEARRNKA